MGLSSELWQRSLTILTTLRVNTTRSSQCNRLFKADLVECIHNTVHVFLHSCKMMSLDDVKTGVMLEFGEIHYQAKLITSNPSWIELPATKEGRHRKSENVGGLVLTYINREEEKN